MLDLLTNPAGALAGLGTLIGLIFGVWLHGRRKGRQAADARIDRERRKARVRHDEIARQSQDMTEEELEAEARKWSKP